MNEHEAKRLTEQLFYSYFPQGGWAERTFEIYLNVVGQLPRALGEQVVERLISASASFPRIANIRREALEIGLGLPTAATAWEQAMTVHAERHPLVREVMEMFGGSFTMRVDDAPGALRTQFMKAYEDQRERMIARYDLRDLELEAAVS